MPKWTPERKKRCIRNPDGTFKEWTGGKSKAQLKKKSNTFQGIAVHVGKEFKRQHGRTAKNGDIVRFKTQSGKHHKQAFWYVKTKNVWRRSPTATRKPTKAQVNKVRKNSRKGR